MQQVACKSICSETSLLHNSFSPTGHSHSHHGPLPSTRTITLPAAARAAASSSVRFFQTCDFLPCAASSFCVLWSDETMPSARHLTPLRAGSCQKKARSQDEIMLEAVDDVLLTSTASISSSCLFFFLRQLSDQQGLD